MDQDLVVKVVFLFLFIIGIAGFPLLLHALLNRGIKSEKEEKQEFLDLCGKQTKRDK